MSDDAETQWKCIQSIYDILRTKPGCMDLKRYQASSAIEIALRLQDSGQRAQLPAKDIAHLAGNIMPFLYEYFYGESKYIDAACKAYFSRLHSTDRVGYDSSLSIEFSEKNAGVQAGRVCKVSRAGKTIRTYFIKTHQHGPTNSVNKSIQPPDAKELFIYKLMELIGIGPAVHFILPVTASRRTLYIATEAVEMIPVTEANSKLLNSQALNEIDLIGRILCLSDCSTNSSNYGQVGDRAVIIDFRIATQRHYCNQNLIEEFYSANSVYNYDTIPVMFQALSIPKAEKKDIMITALKKWNLIKNIDETAGFVSRFVSFSVKSQGINIKNDLDRYISAVKQTVNDMLSKFKNDD